MMKNKVLILLLAGLLIGLVTYHIQSPSKGKPTKGSPAVEKKKGAEESLEFETVKRKHLAEGWGRNPFFRTEERVKEVKALPTTPSLQEEVKAPSLKLEMIFTANAQRVAIVSGQSVKEGDKVGEEVVVRIDSDRVILKKDGKQRTVKLDPFSVPFQVEERRPR